jgi:hypothetical protein
MSKYHNKKVVIDGYKFDSLLEGERYTQLKLMVTGGLISHLEPHPVYVLLPKRKGEREIKHIPDFRYYEIDTDKTVVEDVKSSATKTAVWSIKRRLFVDKYPDVIYRVVMKKDMR